MLRKLLRGKLECNYLLASLFGPLYNSEVGQDTRRQIDLTIMALSPDHLVYAAPDLEVAIDNLSERLGVRPSSGGKHPNGTHNALLALSNSCYLEIIAPDPTQSRQEGGPPLAFGLDRLQVPRVVTWAVLAPSLEDIRTRHRLQATIPVW